MGRGSYLSPEDQTTNRGGSEIWRNRPCVMGQAREEDVSPGSLIQADSVCQDVLIT